MRVFDETLLAVPERLFGERVDGKSKQRFETAASNGDKFVGRTVTGQ